VGYPPNAAQVKAFAADPSASKRAAMVDQLLSSEDFADYWSRLFAEVYFGNYHDVTMSTMPAMSKPASARIVTDFLKWFKLKLQKDAPYTEIVAAMLEARGSDEGDPALAYKLSFYSGEGIRDRVRQRLRPPSAGHPDGLLPLSRRVLGQVDRRGLLRPGRLHLRPEGAARGRQRPGGRAGQGDVRRRRPHQHPRQQDRQPGVHQSKIGPARTVFLGHAEAPKGADRMKFLSQTMTGKSNPQLARALVNRVWAWLLGRGIVHPVDDFRERGNAPLSKGLPRRPRARVHVEQPTRSSS
jgi:hypothetical protein